MHNIEFVSTLELFKLTQSNNSLILIDTRSEAEYRKGHLPNAIHMPAIFSYLSSSTSEGMKQLEKTFIDLFGKAGLSGKEHVVFYDDALNTDFGRACRGAFLLLYFKYAYISILNGGFQTWKAMKLPIDTEDSKANEKCFVAKEKELKLIVDIPQLLQALSDLQVIILDVRDTSEWIGQTAAPGFTESELCKGRIPGAYWIEWRRFIKSAHYGYVFKNPEEILAECFSAGISQNDNIYLYCYRGARAALVYFALMQAGFKNVSIYFASWHEWAQCSNVPVEEGFPKISRRII